MLTVSRSLLRLYPAEYRKQFGEEMFALLLELGAENANRRFIERAKFYLRETAGLICGALREHLRILTGADVGPTLPMRRFAMRDGFRFPKSTAILMAIILAGVVVAIRKGEAIAASLPNVSQPIAPIHSAPSYLLPGVVAGFIFFYAAGLAGWAVLFALRRSGIHRLADLSEQK
jgi:hypothetical protein